MCRRQLLDIPNGNQRMLVDSVFVEKISDNTTTNFFEIREYPSQQSNLVHRQQRVVDALTILHHVQHEPASSRIIRERTIGRSQPPLDGRKSGGIQSRLLVMCFCEGFNHLEGIVELGREADTVRTSNDGGFPKTG